MKETVIRILTSNSRYEKITKTFKFLREIFLELEILGIFLKKKKKQQLFLAELSLKDQNENIFRYAEIENVKRPHRPFFQSYLTMR